MINLTTALTQNNISRWQVIAFDLNTGRVTLRFWSPANTSPSPRWVDKDCQLSDTLNQSTGCAVNPAPQHWNDKVITVGPGPKGVAGMGAANSLANAQAAYANAYAASGGGANVKHNAGLRAVEGSALTDVWVSAELGGT